MKRAMVVLPLVLAVACGGSSGPGKKAYLAKAEAICKGTKSQIDALPTPSTPAAVATYAAGVVAAIDKAYADLNALALPSKDKKDLRAKFLDPFHSELGAAHEYVTKIQAAVAAHNLAALQQLVTNTPKPVGADLTWMKQYGFKECAGALSSS